MKWSMLVPVGTLSANVGLLLGRTASVCARDILLALGLGAHLSFILARRLLFASGLEGDTTTLDDGIYIVSTVLVAHLNSVYAARRGGCRLVMKESHARECHGNAILVTGVNHMVIAHAAASLCDVLHAALVCTLHIIAEGEEGIAAK